MLLLLGGQGWRVTLGDSLSCSLSRTSGFVTFKPQVLSLKPKSPVVSTSFFSSYVIPSFQVKVHNILSCSKHSFFYYKG